MYVIVKISLILFWRFYLLCILKRKCKRLLLVMMGSLIYAIGVNMFLIPHKLLSGGVAGIAIMLQYLTDIQSGYYILLINIPIFLIAFKEVDLDFGILALLE
ncbi:YitT family protein [Clostridium botulinum]|nr:YitT family protein [Clostridium botulinum]